MRDLWIAASCILLLACALSAGEAKTLALDLGGGTTLDLVEVPAGSFSMGSPATEKERQKYEEPVHEVALTQPFFVGKFEVTNKQFRAFRPAFHSRFPGSTVGDALDGDDQPALYVSWFDAAAFCQWLSQKSGKTVRLPTEAEWEYACRAGTQTRFSSGDKASLQGSEDLAKVAWTGGISQGVSHPVGKKEPNAFGLCDMHGNAWEWCWDWFGDDYYAKSPKENPQGPETGRARCLRGGSYLYWQSYFCRSDARYSSPPAAREPVTGFRVVVSDAFKPAWPELPAEKPRQIAPGYTPRTPAEKDVFQKFGGPICAVVKPETPPAIDGKLDDACWTKAQPLVMRNLFGRASPPAQKTAVKACADAKNFYVAFDCAEAEMDRLLVKGDKRDSDVWAGDSVELFLDPEHTESAKGYYQISVNPAGVTLDTGLGKTDWNPDLKIGTSKSDKGWIVELSVPLSELAVAADAIPKIWGVEFTRYRPEIATEKPKLGTLVPHSWPVDRPDLMRLAEDSAWAPTLFTSNHVPTAFGHAMVEAGTKETAPPEKLFEVIVKEDFSKDKGQFDGGEVVDGGYLGAGKALHFKDAEVACLQGPFEKFSDWTVLVALRTQPGGSLYWHTFGKLAKDNKICFQQVDTVTRNPVGLMPSFNYCDGAGRIDATSNGVIDPYFAGMMKHHLWFSEPTIGRIQFAGPLQWAVVHTRLDRLQTQHPDNKVINPDKETLKGVFIHNAGGKEFWIGGIVVFRGMDIVPPEKVSGVACAAEGADAVLKWQPAADNTLTLWYKVYAGADKPETVVAEVQDLSVKLPLETVKGKKLFVAGVDYFENEGAPSDPVPAP